MSPSPPRTRPYAKRKRQASQDETRHRIVEATMQLHEEVGPRATSISAIAERAGVTRLTVYRHFPDETAVFQACTSHWLSLNPPPDPAVWQDVEAPLERAVAAVAALYRYYEGTRAMWTAAHRDVDAVPAMQGPMEAFEAYLAGIADDLFAALRARRHRRQLRATLGHALRFPTWASLQREGLAPDAQARLVGLWLAGLA